MDGDRVVESLRIEGDFEGGRRQASGPRYDGSTRSEGIDCNRFIGAGFREARESIEVWSQVDSNVGALNPRLAPLHDGRENDL